LAELNRIIRKKNDNFTIVDNTILKDKNVSMKAKALHITVMSLPSDWNFSISGLVSIFKEGERAIRSGIQELIEFGYCNFTKVKGDKGYFIYQYEFLEQQNPLMQNAHVENAQSVENAHVQNADVENADVQNSHIYKELINKEFTDKELKEEPLLEKASKTRFQIPTESDVILYLQEELSSKYQKFKNLPACESFFEKWFSYYESNGWKVGRNQMKNWKASIRQWLSKDYSASKDEKLDESSFENWTDERKRIYKILQEA
jgi:hypothetical protein